MVQENAEDSRSPLDNYEGWCPSCGHKLALGKDVTIPCSGWCPMCQENLVFDGKDFQDVGTKAYGWCGKHEYHVG